MAKKAVAKFKAERSVGKTSTKCIKMEKSPKSGAYSFREEMIPNELVNDFFSGKI